jgi:tRNA-dihydrouridine synthase
LERHPLLPRIERHLRRTGVAASTFGRDSVGDPGLVADLRRGRYPRPSLARRIEAWLDSVGQPEETGR